MVVVPLMIGGGGRCTSRGEGRQNPRDAWRSSGGGDGRRRRRRKKEEGFGGGDGGGGGSS